MGGSSLAGSFDNALILTRKKQANEQNSNRSSPSVSITSILNSVQIYVHDNSSCADSILLSNIGTYLCLVKQQEARQA